MAGLAVRLLLRLTISWVVLANPINIFAGFGGGVESPPSFLTYLFLVKHMNIAAQRRANLLSNTNLVLMFSLVFIAGIMTLVHSNQFGLFLFVFTLIRVGQMLFMDVKWVVSPITMIIIVCASIGNVIGYLI